MNQLMKQRYQEMHGEKGDGGFTLIELLVVIVILAILAAVVVFAVGGITDKGTNSACKADYKTVQTAEEAYFANQTGNAPTYTDIATLVAGHYLAATPKLHGISNPSTTGYTVTDLTGSNCTATNDT